MTDFLRMIKSIDEKALKAEIAKLKRQLKDFQQRMQSDIATLEATLRAVEKAKIKTVNVPEDVSIAVPSRPVGSVTVGAIANSEMFIANGDPLKIEMVKSTDNPLTLGSVANFFTSENPSIQVPITAGATTTTVAIDPSSLIAEIVNEVAAIPDEDEFTDASVDYSSRLERRELPSLSLPPDDPIPPEDKSEVIGPETTLPKQYFEDDVKAELEIEPEVNPKTQVRSYLQAGMNYSPPEKPCITTAKRSLAKPASVPSWKRSSIADKAATYLECAGKSSAMAIGAGIDLEQPNKIKSILEGDERFEKDERGMWDLRK